MSDIETLIFPFNFTVEKYRTEELKHMYGQSEAHLPKNRITGHLYEVKSALQYPNLDKLN